MACHEIEIEWRWPTQNAPADFDKSVIACRRYNLKILRFRLRWTKSENFSAVCQTKLIIFCCADVRSRTILVI